MDREPPAVTFRDLATSAIYYAALNGRDRSRTKVRLVDVNVW